MKVFTVNNVNHTFISYILLGLIDLLFILKMYLNFFFFHIIVGLVLDLLTLGFFFPFFFRDFELNL